MIEKVLITGVAAEGVAIGRVNEKVIFVPWLAPGDIADIQITRSKSSFMEGKAVSIHSFSEERANPFCIHFGNCGGCKWQHLDYSKQLIYKQQQVVDSLQRIAHIDNPPVKTIVGANPIREYRNKLEFTFSNRRWLEKLEMKKDESFLPQNGLGFHLPGLFDKILDIQECHLMPSIVNQIRNRIREYALERNLEFYDYRRQEGFLRNLIFRTTTTGDLMLIVVASRFCDELRDLLSFVQSSFSDITSLMFVINAKRNDSLNDLSAQLFAGLSFITEELDGVKFRIGPLSFFQTNAAQALKLYQLTRDYAALTGREVVYDLYTGTGTIANFLAEKSSKVIGVEYVPQAIEDAHENSRINNVGNTVFYAGDMAKVLTEEFVSRNGVPNVVITDPPRAGMHKDVVKMLLRMSPARIVYVSCNPATQARDIELLKDAYELVEVQPVDMFPHTHHVESVALLCRK